MRWTGDAILLCNDYDKCDCRSTTVAHNSLENGKPILTTAASEIVQTMTGKRKDFNGISMLFEYLISIEKTFFADNVSFLKWLQPFHGKTVQNSLAK